METFPDCSEKCEVIAMFGTDRGCKETCPWKFKEDGTPCTEEEAREKLVEELEIIEKKLRGE